MEVHGFCDDRFRKLESVFRSNLAMDDGKGASFAVTLHGVPVVDLWGGWRDIELTRPWEADTVVRVMSTSKIPVIIAVLMAVDRGLLDLDVPIAEYWPEFARHGKGAITTRHVMVHRSGVPGFGCVVPIAKVSDWAYMTGLLEDAELWYEPGTVSCYHANTFGYLVGEVVHRVTGVPFVEFIHRELLDPLGVDFHFSITSPADLERVAAVWPVESMPELPSKMFEAVMLEVTLHGDLTSPASLAWVSPSWTGLSNARALTRIGAVLATGGELDGHRYLRPATIAEASRTQSVAVDELFGPCRYGLGFGLHREEFPAPTPTTFHWGGIGGSYVTMDPASGISSAFAPAKLRLESTHGNEPRGDALWLALGEICRQLG